MVRNIIFVCGHNAGRSQIAQAFFNHLNTNPEFRGESAGGNIADEVNPQAITAMKEIGIDMTDKTKYFPKVLDEGRLYFKKFSMGCNVSCGVEIDEDLGIDDPAGQPIEKVREIRDQIKIKIENIIGELNG